MEVGKKKKKEGKTTSDCTLMKKIQVMLHNQCIFHSCLLPPELSPVFAKRINIDQT